MSELSREQIEEWREMLLCPLPWTSERQRVETINTLCDMALRSESGRAGVIEELPEVHRWVNSDSFQYCPKCSGALDEGYECTKCGYDFAALHNFASGKSAPNEMAEMPEGELRPTGHAENLLILRASRNDWSPAEYREIGEAADELRRLSDAGTVRVPREPTIRERQFLEGKVGVDWLEGWTAMTLSASPVEAKGGEDKP
jgi:hypothetical protein